jgi:hypothetical protein
MNFMNADANWTVMIQRKDKPGKFGIKLDLEEIAPKEMKQLKAEAGNRFRMWFIGKDQKLLPGTRDIKMNIGRRGFPDEITSVRMRACKILGEITRPLIELDHRWRTGSPDNDGARKPG